VSHVRLADEDFNENDKAGAISKAESNFAAASGAILQRSLGYVQLVSNL